MRRFGAIACFLLGFGALAEPPPLPMDPGIEGIYDVRVTCSRRTSDCDNSNYSMIARMTLVDTRLPLGIFMTLGTKGNFIDTILGATAGPAPNHVSGSPKVGSGFGGRGGDGGGRFAYFDYTVNDETGDITGSIMDARTPTLLSIQGKKIRIAKDLFVRNAVSPYPTAQLEGIYRGNLGQMTGKLVVSRRPDGMLIGHFESDAGSQGSANIMFEYIFGTWEPEKSACSVSPFSIRTIFRDWKFDLECQNRGPNGKPEFDGFQYTVYSSLNAKFSHVK